jgi:hypothetical protein
MLDDQETGGLLDFLGSDGRARRSAHAGTTPSLQLMRAVQITRFGGPEVLDIVELAEPEAADRQRLYDVSTTGVNYADTHHWLS